MSVTPQFSFNIASVNIYGHGYSHSTFLFPSLYQFSLPLHRLFHPSVNTVFCQRSFELTHCSCKRFNYAHSIIQCATISHCLLCCVTDSLWMISRECGARVSFVWCMFASLYSLYDRPGCWQIVLFGIPCERALSNRSFNLSASTPLCVIFRVTRSLPSLRLGVASWRARAAHGSGRVALYLKASEQTVIAFAFFLFMWLLCQTLLQIKCPSTYAVKLVWFICAVAGTAQQYCRPSHFPQPWSALDQIV